MNQGRCTITISQALRRIAALKGELKRLEARRLGVINFAVENPPAWDFDEVQQQIEDTRKELVALRTKVAVANATTMVSTSDDESPEPLLTVVNELQELKGMISNWEAILEKAKPGADYIVQSSVYRGGELVDVEVTMKCACPQRRADEYLSELRATFARLNAVVETANHTTILG